jgi:hypothetical protein
LQHLKVNRLYVILSLRQLRLKSLKTKSNN